MVSEPTSNELRVVIFAPVGRDAALTQAVLAKAGIGSRIATSVSDLCDGLAEGVGALLLTEEALNDPEIGLLTAALEAQPSWSDVSVLLFAGSDQTSAQLHTLRRLEVLRNVTLLDRPLRIAAVISTIEAALRGRRRQYELRDVLVALHSARTEAEAANRLKDEFLATLSHELRTPLNAIVGWVSMLRRSQVAPAQVSRVLQIIERNAQSQTHLVADVLDVSSMVTGRMHLEPEPLVLARVVIDAVDTIRPSADAKGVALRLDVRAERAVVRGDSRRLHQVFWNLLSNAVKFTPRGGRVDVTLDDEPPMITFVVRDTGIGLSPEFLPYAFDRFRQGDQTFTRAHGGLGLGLAIVKYVVEMHGGQVSAASDGLDQGAAFTVRLPAARVATCEAARGADAPDAFRADLNGHLILFVDDDETTRDLVATMLQVHGARVRTAASAGSALAAFDIEKPSLVLADLGMPGEDGLAMIRRVRQRPPAQGGAVPAVALSAFARVEDRRAALEAGYDDFLTKPAMPQDIVRAVARWLPATAHQSGIRDSSDVRADAVTQESR